MRWVVALALLFLASAAQAQVSPVPPIIAGTLDLGTGTTVQAGAVNINPPSNGLSLQVTQSFDPALDSIGARNIMFSTTISPSVATTNTVENSNSFVYINGPGAQNGEVNLHHTYEQINAGASVAASEGYESSMDNYGTISSFFNNFLALSTNTASGTAASIQGIKIELVNANTAASSIGMYAAIDFEAMTGGGSLPTSYYFLRDADTNASISTLGGVQIGGLQTAGAGTLNISGPDTSPNTFPLSIRTGSGALALLIGDDNSIHVGASATPGVTCTGTPTSSYATVNGIVTHC